MPLKVLSMEADDFDTMIKHADIYAPGDDLVAPPTPTCWPVSTQADAERRLKFHMNKQKARFLGDTSAHYLKLVDDETGEIVSMARWHWYPEGYSYSDRIHWETHNPVEGQSWPEGMNVELHNFILSTRDAEREHWQEKGKPCWMLMHLVTRTSQRRRGAASLLINWGVERAKRDGTPAYLEAGVMGVPVYVKHGFQQVGHLTKLDLRPYGLDMDFVMAKMAIFPDEFRTPGRYNK